MHRMLRDLALLLSPVLPFTSDEVWPLVPGAGERSVHLALFPAERAPGRRRARALVRPCSRCAGVVTKALEEARNAEALRRRAWRRG